MNLWYTRLFTAHYFSVRRSRSSALRYAWAAIWDEVKSTHDPGGMKPRWPPVPVSARSWRYYEKNRKLWTVYWYIQIQNNRNTIWQNTSKSKTEATHEFSTVVHSISNTTTWLPVNRWTIPLLRWLGNLHSALMWWFVSMVLGWLPCDSPSISSSVWKSCGL